MIWEKELRVHAYPVTEVPGFRVICECKPFLKLQAVDRNSEDPYSRMTELQILLHPQASFRRLDFLDDLELAQQIGGIWKESHRLPC